VDVSKDFITSASSQEGAFVTSTTTAAPFSASASPSPVTVLTPELGEAAIASCPRLAQLGHEFTSLASTEAFLPSAVDSGVSKALCFVSPIYGYQNSSCLVLALLLADLNRLFRLLWFWNRLLIHLRSGFCAPFGFGYRRGGFVVKHRWFPFVDWPFAG
jgi:hypothetical protein